MDNFRTYPHKPSYNIGTVIVEGSCLRGLEQPDVEADYYNGKQDGTSYDGNPGMNGYNDCEQWAEAVWNSWTPERQGDSGLTKESLIADTVGDGTCFQIKEDGTRGYPASMDTQGTYTGNFTMQRCAATTGSSPTIPETPQPTAEEIAAAAIAAAVKCATELCATQYAACLKDTVCAATITAQTAPPAGSSLANCTATEEFSKCVTTNSGNLNNLSSSGAATQFGSVVGLAVAVAAAMFN